MKILVSDYDKTFYLNDKDIVNNIKLIKEFRKKGNLFIIATGRSYYDFIKKYNQYNFPYDYVLINHGATIIDNKGNILNNISIDNEIISEIENNLQLDKANKYFCCSGLDSRVLFDKLDLTKINVEYNDNQVALDINEYLNNNYSDYITSYFVRKGLIEIISKNTSKLHALDFLLKKLSLENEKIYTIGDGISDIELVKKYHGYCMCNSVVELKKIAQKEYNSVSILIKEIMEDNNEHL